MLRWPWPLPALVAWGAAWLTFQLAVRASMPPSLALFLGTTTGVVFSLGGATLTRKLAMALGFPLSWWLWVGGVSTAHLAWVWLVPLGLFLWIYPPASWKDAPLFPTPPEALYGLRELAPLPLAAQVMDAGCGLGDGLIALEREYPDVHLHGIERSTPLRLLCALRCRWARVTGGDMWTADWSPYQMVYLFQRPESMPRACDKADREMAPGSWLVSLDFEARDCVPTYCLQGGDERPVWVYQVPLVWRSGAPGPALNRSAVPGSTSGPAAPAPAPADRRDSPGE